MYSKIFSEFINEILLSDFNMDFQSGIFVRSLMQSFKIVQLASDPTHRGRLLYHVYANKYFLLLHRLLATVTPVYYSNHKAVELTTGFFLKNYFLGFLYH